MIALQHSQHFLNVTSSKVVPFKIVPSKLLPLTSITVAVFTAPALGVSVAHAGVSESNTQPSSSLFLECGALQKDSARLACYDAVATGQDKTLGNAKKPLDIAKTLQATFIDWKPQAVLADETLESNSKVVDGLKDDSKITIKTLSPEAKVGVTQDAISKYTPLSLAYDLDKNSEHGLWTARNHNPMYLLPLYAHFDPNRAPVTPTLDADPTTPSIDPYVYSRNEYRPLELKAQISLKSKIMEDVFDTNADLWFGYTQQMHWQVYNEDNSRPFRATDYMPEVFLTQPVKADLPFNGQLRMLGVGAIHHSNGQSDPLSRSWNRIYLMGGAEWDKLTVVPKIWAHIKNESDANPSDNPDITDYYGHGELQLSYDLGKREVINAIGRYNFDTQKGGVEVNYSHPLTDSVNGFMQIFHGYGESIVDYNDETTSVGVGVTLSDWKGL